MRPLLGAFLVLAGAPPAAAQLVPGRYERPPLLGAGQVLPARLLRSGHHRVLDEVRLAGHTLELVVESDFGTFRPRSLALAIERIREIDVLAQAIDAYNRRNVRLAEDLRGRLEVGADSFVDILTSPLATTSSMVGQLGEKVGQTFAELGTFPDEALRRERLGPDPYARMVPGDPVLAQHKRSVARQLGLDVYSSNPRVQEFLNTVAAARSSGQRSAGVLSVARRRDLAPLAGGRIDESVAAALARLSIRELYARNRERLLALGVEEALADRFLSHPPLSPRHKTAITAYLEFLAGVRNPGVLLGAALAARDEAGALAHEQGARMLARYQDTVAPLAELLDAGEVVLAAGRAGELIAVLPFDYLYWSRDSDETFSGLARYAARRGARALEVLMSGQASPRARSELARRGYRLRERFLLAPG